MKGEQVNRRRSEIVAKDREEGSLLVHVRDDEKEGKVVSRRRRVKGGHFWVKEVDLRR